MNERGGRLLMVWLKFSPRMSLVREEGRESIGSLKSSSKVNSCKVEGSQDWYKNDQNSIWVRKDYEGLNY